MEKLAHQLVEIAMKTADNPALEDRCLKALSKLGSLHIPNQFFHSVGNLIYSLKSNPRRKPVIREYADRVLTRWMRQLYSRAPEKPTAAMNKPVCNLKPQSTTKALQNPKPNKADSILKRRKLRMVDPTRRNKEKSPKGSDELRSNIRRQVFEGLSMVFRESSNVEFIDSCDPVGVSQQVESQLFQVWGAAIKNYRSFLYNLKDPKNPDFRRKILTGKLKPEKIATLRPEDMASDRRRIENHFIRETALNKCIVGTSLIIL